MRVRQLGDNVGLDPFLGALLGKEAMQVVAAAQGHERHVLHIGQVDVIAGGQRALQRNAQEVPRVGQVEVGELLQVLWMAAQKADIHFAGTQTRQCAVGARFLHFNLHAGIWPEEFTAEIRRRRLEETVAHGEPEAALHGRKQALKFIERFKGVLGGLQKTLSIGSEHRTRGFHRQKRAAAFLLEFSHRFRKCLSGNKEFFSRFSKVARLGNGNKRLDLSYIHTAPPLPAGIISCATVGCTNGAKFYVARQANTQYTGVKTAGPEQCRACRWPRLAGSYAPNA